MASLDSIKKPTWQPRYQRYATIVAHPSITTRSRSSHALSLFALKALIIIVIIGSALWFKNLARDHYLFTITSSSMSPTIPTGSIIAVQPHKESSQLPKVGDIITFHGTQGTTTHRVIEIIPSVSGTQFRTQGDANPIADGNLVQDSNLIGTTKIVVPYAGYITTWLKTSYGFSLAILLPATLIILHELLAIKKSWQQLRRTLPLLAPQPHRLRFATLLLLALLFPAIVAQAFTTPATSINSITITTDIFSSPSPTPTITPSPSPIISPTPTISPSPTITPSPSVSPSVTPSPSPDISPSPSVTASPSPTSSPTPEQCQTNVNVDQSNTNTGPNSTNQNSTDISEQCTINETTTTDSTNNIDIDVNTGNNQQNNNTQNGSTSSGDVGITITISN